MHKRRITAAFVVASTTLALLAGTLVGVGVAHASADPVCTSDLCVVLPDTVQTPLGPATITVDAANVVTVHLATTVANTVVLGVPFSTPLGRSVHSHRACHALCGHPSRPVEDL